MHKGTMKEIELEELKSLQLDILIKVHEFCLRNNLNYSLTGGTLLGAIRHKGYIPWDDDIDICMPRPSYNKFLQTFNGFYKDLTVYAPELDKNYYAPYANVCDDRTVLEEGVNGHRNDVIGVKIDVFPIDGIVDNKECQKTIEKKVLWYNRILSSKRSIISYDKSLLDVIKLLIKKMVFSVYSFEAIQKKIMQLVTKFSFDEVNSVAQQSFLPYGLKVYSRELFEDYTDVDFEGYKFKSMKNYDVYLRNLYGDYMQLPPKSQQVPKHDFIAYWK